MGETPVPFEYHRGIYLPEAGLWLDPQRRTPLAFVSHAHSDHARRHDRVLATPETLELMRVRRLVRDEATALPFGRQGGLKNPEAKSGNIGPTLLILIEKTERNLE